jgi:heme a synthase
VRVSTEVARVLDEPAEELGCEPVAPIVRAWLFSIWGAILVMVAIGGITRLTGSGLSIVEWKPLMGAIPPLNERDWLEVFQKYQATPEFRHANHWMELADFKRIFFWEYVHRLWGRMVGLIVLVPWLYFALRRQLSKRLSLQTLGLFALGGLQGALGWYMVASGLADQPRVSHFRLAAHLLLAFATGALALWVALDATTPRSPARSSRPLHRRLIAALIALVLVQVVYGAFMAGTRAGYYYGTFPDMHGSYGPASFFTSGAFLSDALHSAPAIHWLHRFFGWLCLGYAVFLWVLLLRVEPRRSVRRAAALLAAVVFVQFNLGALTVVQRVKLELAVTHQVMAYVLLSCAVLLLHRACGSHGRTVRDALEPA